MKKAQGQIITVILIILLVLAAIVVLWQVVNRTVDKGSDEIDAQSKCIGLSIKISVLDGGGAITVKPNKDIEGWRVYVNGVQGTESHDTTSVNAFVSASTIDDTAGVDAEVTSAGLIGGKWCDGLEKITVAAA